MARKVGQFVRRGSCTWLVRVYTGRDLETKKRMYLNQTIHGAQRDVQILRVIGNIHHPARKGFGKRWSKNNFGGRFARSEAAAATSSSAACLAAPAAIAFSGSVKRTVPASSV